MIVRTFILPWLVPLLRLVLLACPLVLVDSSSLALAAIWALPISSWALSSDHPDDVVCDMSLLVLVGCLTLHLSPGTMEWLLPLLVAVALAFLEHAFSDYETVSPPKRNAGYFPALVVFLHAAFQVSFHDYSMNLAVASIPSTILMLRSGHVSSWLYLQLCLLATMDLWGMVFVIQALCILVLFLLTVPRAPPSSSACWDVLRGYGETAQALVRAVSSVLASRAPYMLLVLASVGVLAGTMGSVWYTAHADFPAPIREVCDAGLEVIDAVRHFYEFTNDPDLQDVMALAAPQIGMARATIFRIVKPVYPILVAGSRGATVSFTPLHSLLALLAFGAGPLIAGLAVVASVFPQRAKFSRWLWSLGACGTGIFSAVCFLASTPAVSFIGAVFRESTVTRTYTEEGTRAGWACAFLVASCVVLSALPGPAPKPSRPRTRGKLRVIPKEEPAKKPWFELSPATWMLAGTLLFFALVVVGSGSPFSRFGIVKKPSSSPPWLISTMWDKLSPVIAKMKDLIVSAIPYGKAGEVVFFMQMVAVVLMRKFGCLACICVSVDGIKEGFEEAWDQITRRRLLAVESWDVCDEPPANTCSAGINICVSDVMDATAPMAETLTRFVADGLEIAANELAEIILPLIPELGVIDTAIRSISKLGDLADFSLDLDLDFDWSLGFSRVWTEVAVPSMPAWSTLIFVAAVAVIAAVVAHWLGVLTPLRRFAVRSIGTAMAAGLVSLIALVVTLAFVLNAELNTYDYYVDVAFAANLYLYAITLGGFMLAAMLKLSETPGDETVSSSETVSSTEKRVLLASSSPRR